MTSIARAVHLLLVFIAIQTVFSVPYLSLELALGEGGLGIAAIAAAVAAGLIAAVCLLSPRLIRFRAAAEEALTAPSTAAWLCLLAAVGVSVRIGWVLLFPGPMVSDGSVYFNLAKQLSDSGIYRDSRGEFAFWPPGYPFYLVPFMKVFGGQEWVPFVANLVLYVGSLLVVHDLARRCSGVAVPRLATLLVALWPNYVFTSGMASKELLLVTLVPLALACYLRAVDASGRGRAAVYLALCGVTLAFASLTQPGLLLLPMTLVVFEAARRSRLRVTIARIGIVGAVFLTLVGLWTYRNFVVLKVPVLIATSGGSTFYRANNPLATGGHTERGERSLEGMGELERHRRGMEWGVEWIRSHPGDFLKLAWKKQILFLGDDGVGVYETMKRGLGIGDGRYAALKMVSSLYWLGLWLVTLSSLLYARAAWIDGNAVPILLALTVCYLWFIDSIFESGGRHHMPLIGVLSVMATVGPSRR